MSNIRGNALRVTTGRAVRETVVAWRNSRRRAKVTFGCPSLNAILHKGLFFSPIAWGGGGTLFFLSPPNCVPVPGLQQITGAERAHVALLYIYLTGVLLMPRSLRP